MPPETTENENVKKGGFFKELFKFVIIAFLIVVPFRWFIAQPFIVNGASMHPTFAHGEYLIVDQLSYRLKDPQRSEVVIFRYPRDPSKYFIKRVIGLPGEIIEITGSQITIKNREHPEGFQIDEPYIQSQANNKLKFELSSDEYFVMGDNRPSSSDSRSWGPLKRDFMVGRPIIRLFPIKKLQLFPGDQSS